MRKLDRRASEEFGSQTLKMGRIRQDPSANPGFAHFLFAPKPDDRHVGRLNTTSTESDVIAETAVPNSETLPLSASELVAPTEPTEPTMAKAPTTIPPLTQAGELPPARPIGEFAGRDDFPTCTLNEHLDIGGFTGVVIKIINQSLKVKSPEGVVQSFNAIRLKRIYGPVIRPEFHEPARTDETRRPAPLVSRRPDPEPEPEADVDAEPPPPPPRREYIAQPNFDAPVKPISEFAGRADFPKCALGEHLEINGATGVAVEVVNQSLKVRAPEGLLRSYNIPILRKLYGDKR